MWSLSHRLHAVLLKWCLSSCRCDDSGTVPAEVARRAQLVTTVQALLHPVRIPRTLASLVRHTWLDRGRLLQLDEVGSPSALALWCDQWSQGAPVIVTGCDRRVDQSLWQPSSFLREFGHLTADLVDCRNGVVLLGCPMRDFWAGFECVGSRMRDRFGRTRILKLKDWPPGDDFADLLPRRFRDLLQALPFPDYTHRSGSLNLVSHLPEHFVRPDLGPKMYVAYGSALSPDVGSTNLHLDMSDAVNVMMYVGIPTDDVDQRHETGTWN